MQWIAAVITSIGIYLNIAKNKWCFVVLMLGNGILIYVSEEIAMKIIFVVYSCFNIYGFYEW